MDELYDISDLQRNERKLIQSVPRSGRAIRENFEVVNEADLLYIIANGALPKDFDEIQLTYVSAGNGVGEIETVTYLKNSVTIRTLTLTYNGDNKLSGVAYA